MVLKNRWNQQSPIRIASCWPTCSAHITLMPRRKIPYSFASACLQVAVGHAFSSMGKKQHWHLTNQNWEFPNRTHVFVSATFSNYAMKYNLSSGYCLEGPSFAKSQPPLWIQEILAALPYRSIAGTPYRYIKYCTVIIIYLHNLHAIRGI